MKQLFLFLLLAGMTTLMSCKGEQGDPGPAGVAGRDGVDGVDGVDGTNGTNGTNGTDGASIKNYFTTIYGTAWITESDDRLNMDVPVPIITDEIYNTGLVIVYIRGIGQISWLPTPFSYAFNGGTQTYHVEITPGNVRIVSSSDGTSPYNGDLEIRVLAATSTGLARNPDLDWTNYEAVKAALNLAD